ncbi:hypothetical protein NLI96_g8003 [Meripilus lineatus]|uniref:Ribosomal protein S21 n=1 Tax=Meripilus lineatus TaxID=2056292 RepID=A0AAD5UY45_9APHY|nr:hypothetical protein NLI96_g8003 [Physisporinus lineatus]
MTPKESSWTFLSSSAKKVVEEATTVAQEPEVVWEHREKNHVRHLHSPPDAYSGRSLYVGRDLGLTFNYLQRTLRQNNVTRELRMAERHEKKGVKRRRLSSQRWRRRFAHEVRKKVQLVNEIRARGA